jgi:hypothetical protein
MRSLHVGLFLTCLVACGDRDLDDDAKSKEGVVEPAVVRALAPTPGAIADPTSGYTSQARLGFHDGDQWEPAIAADTLGHVYVIYPQYGGVPGCPACPSPTAILQVSNDGGKDWGSPHLIAAPGSGQWDVQMVVDPADGRTVYAAWLQDGKSTTAVARSTDFGATWTTKVASLTNAGTDKDILAVRGNDVYVGYEHQQKMYVAASHDGGATFTEVGLGANNKIGLALGGGATVDPAGRVFYAWAGYEQSGGAKGTVHLQISRSVDGGATWSLTELDRSASPPDCSAFSCGWAYLGAQITVASDSAGRLYALWNAGAVNQGPERIYYATSADAGASWSPRRELSTAPAGTAHAFPALAAGAAGDVRAAWMDSRAGSMWNVWLRTSLDGGATWSAETALSTYVPDVSYIQPAGFRYPFGDYFELAIDGSGTTHAVWGEGYNYDTPGSIWYARGR